MKPGIQHTVLGVAIIVALTLAAWKFPGQLTALATAIGGGVLLVLRTKAEGGDE